MSNDEELFDGPTQKEIVKHFSQEKPKEKSMDELIEYAYQMKEQREECEKEYKLALEKIKSAWKLDKIEGKKQVIPASEYEIIVTKRNGSCKIDWEKWAEDTVGADAVKELEQAKELAKSGKADCKYIEVGKEVVAVEIVKKANHEFPF